MSKLQSLSFWERARVRGKALSPGRALDYLHSYRENGDVPGPRL